MNNQSPENAPKSVEFGEPVMFETPSATVIFANNKDVGTHAVKRGDSKTVFTVGEKYGPRNIDPKTDEAVALLAKVSPYEFCTAAATVADRYTRVKNMGQEERNAVEADHERIFAAAFKRVETNEFTAEEAAAVWQVFDNRTRAFSGIPYSGTESIADVPVTVTPSDNVGRVALMA